MLLFFLISFIIFCFERTIWRKLNIFYPLDIGHRQTFCHVFILSRYLYNKHLYLQFFFSNPDFLNPFKTKKKVIRIEENLMCVKLIYMKIPWQSIYIKLSVCEKNFHVLIVTHSIYQTKKGGTICFFLKAFRKIKLDTKQHCLIYTAVLMSRKQLGSRFIV
jgi:hypothetical protein